MEILHAILLKVTINTSKLWMGYLYYTDRENCTVVTTVLVLKNDATFEKWSVNVKHAYVHKVFIQCRNVYEELTPYESEYESVLMKGNIH